MALNPLNLNFQPLNFGNPFEALTKGFGQGLMQRREQELFNRDVQTKDYENMIKAAQAMYEPRVQEANIFNTENQARLYGQKADLYPEEARALMNQQNASARNLGSQAVFQEIQNKMAQDAFNRSNNPGQSLGIPEDFAKKVIIGNKYDPLIGENRKRDIEQRMDAAYSSAVLGDKILRRLDQAESIFNAHPDLADTWSKAILNPNKKDEFFSTLARKTVDPEKREAIEKIEKLAADMITMQIESKNSGRVTDFARSMEASRKIHPAGSAGANKFIIQNMRQDLIGFPQMKKVLEAAAPAGIYINTRDPKIFAEIDRQDDEVQAILKELRGG